MELKCSFKNVSIVGTDGVVGWLYTANILNANIEQPNIVIGRVLGEHIPEKTDLDVKSIWFRGTVKFLPKGLGNFFPALKVLIANKCKLESIIREDLKGLEMLETFCVADNLLTSLPSNLFADMKMLQSISFQQNNLGYVSSKLLRPIRGTLTSANFSGNPNIDVWFKSSAVEFTIAQLMETVDQQCQKPLEDDPEFNIENFKEDCYDGFASLWSSGSFSDFTISTADGLNTLKEFPVHKLV